MRRDEPVIVPRPPPLPPYCPLPLLGVFSDSQIKLILDRPLFRPARRTVFLPEFLSCKISSTSRLPFLIAATFLHHTFLPSPYLKASLIQCRSTRTPLKLPRHSKSSFPPSSPLERAAFSLSIPTAWLDIGHDFPHIFSDPP